MNGSLAMKIRTFAYSPQLWPFMSFAFIAIATTRCGDAVR